VSKDAGEIHDDNVVRCDPQHGRHVRVRGSTTGHKPVRWPLGSRPVAVKAGPEDAHQGADVTIGVSGNDITLANTVVLANGETIQERETLRADGTETPAMAPGVVHVANWLGSHVLALITKQGNRNLALITYEVSADGQTLTTRTSGLVEQVVVFKRR